MKTRVPGFVIGLVLCLVVVGLSACAPSDDEGGQASDALPAGASEAESVITDGTMDGWYVRHPTVVRSRRRTT